MGGTVRPIEREVLRTMALATQCPHCHTTFRVAQDQLKLRAGLVRCGHCKQIFNGIEHLLPPEGESKPLPAPSEGLPAEPPPSEPSAAPAASSPDTPTPQADSAPDKVEEPAPTKIFAPLADDPLQRMTLIDVSRMAGDSTDVQDETTTPAYDPDAPDPLAQTIDELSRKPWRHSTKAKKVADDEEPADRIDAEDDEPEFVVKGRRRLRIGRALRAATRIGVIVLLVGLLLQSAYVFRDQIAVRFPAVQPLLAQMCDALGCQVGLPAQIEAVSLESSELQALAPEKNTFVFNALLRNHHATAQAWPNIELTLNDANEQAVARRVFTPRDYLATQEAGKGFAANSEQPIKLFLSLSPLKAAGYRVYLFYP